VTGDKFMMPVVAFTTVTRKQGQTGGASVCCPGAHGTQ
jgi:hypothetical protein